MIDTFKRFCASFSDPLLTGRDRDTINSGHIDCSLWTGGDNSVSRGALWYNGPGAHSTTKAGASKDVHWRSVSATAQRA